MTVPRLPLPLRDELFLLGHDDDNGQPYIDRQALALGLAGAVLIDLFLAGRIVLTSNDDSHPAGEQWLRLRSYQPVGDLIADSAIGYIRHGHANPPVREFLLGFADDLYERARAGLVAAGILRQTTRRRLGGLVHTDTYLLTDSRWSIVARTRLRYVAEGREQPDNHTGALAGLVAALGLTTYLHLDEDVDALAAYLAAIAREHHQSVQAITAAVDTALGDLTTTYR
ncbi:GOLPH3/VPS74 family protein [Micromonospora andamanensis]|uniref:GOLPH3/VPS74 family protein n=1 Tax=Micromonospora andamanensis TaxID=1287068 RepID=UPI0019528557|nr:GPP34 family phosphoprotein [Micromonospora andamanensis]GIJ37360.1 hypothetical protein Vwe01_06850 [Micromonospora andamanensis]